ncbi:hypothetical protein D1007_33954 [Hordeum vulgare]|nr:hypothetical protein D1007_33954 [Hordeum vulgare]
MLSSDEPTISLFPSSSEESLNDSDCESSRGTTKILMDDTNRGGNTGFATENSPVCYSALHTPITGNTPEENALENACLANLAERERLQWSLDARAASDQSSSSRSHKQLFQNDRKRHIEVMWTPLLNLAANTRIDDSILPSDSAAEEGISTNPGSVKDCHAADSAVS